MRRLFRTIAFLLPVLWSLTPGSAGAQRTSIGWYGHTGKYNDCGLQLCYDCITTNGAPGCDGCMRSHFPTTGIFNPFSDTSDLNCNGTLPADPANIYYKWSTGLTDPCWTSFFCFGGAYAAQGTIDQCNMNHPDNPRTGRTAGTSTASTSRVPQRGRGSTVST
jgi:hypothetical protein